MNKFFEQLISIRKGTDIKVLIYLFSISKDKKVVLDRITRAEACETLNLRTTNLSASLRRLKDLGFISGGYGVYTLKL